MNNDFYTPITSGKELRTKLQNGINAICDVVGSTQGYRGRTVLLEDKGLPKPSKDGFTVAESIFLQDKVEALACETAKEASRKTAHEAGDSTSATLVLLQAFFNNSLKTIESGKSAIDVKLSIEKSKEIVLKELEKLSIPLTNEMIYDLAKTSANGDDEIAKIVFEAFDKAGENGSVGHVRSNSDDTYLEYIDGTLVERGFADERFVNVHSNQTVVFDNNPLVLISNINFQTIKQIVPFLNMCAEQNKELLIISEMEFNVLDAIISNVVKRGLKFAVVTPPAIGKKRQELLSDLALVCETEMISSFSGSDFTGRETMFLGVAKSITVTKDNTIIVKHDDTNLEPINGRIAEIKEQLKLATNPVHIQNLEDRIAKLSGGVALIKVGGITPSEVEERIDRVDDAVRAVRSGKEEGIIAGGGVALYHISNDFELDEVTKISLGAPMLKILENASKSDATFGSYPKGFDVKEFKEVDMIKAGIIDSTKAIRNAYSNAISASNSLLMCDNVVTLNK